MSTISVGTTVRLKSGGPVMTVSYLSDSKADCQWFDDKTGNLQHGTFPQASLKVVEIGSDDIPEQPDYPDA